MSTKQEIEAARALFADAISDLEGSGGNVSAFASAALLAAAELYSFTNGDDALPGAFVAILRSQERARATPHMRTVN